MRDRDDVKSKYSLQEEAWRVKEKYPKFRTVTILKNNKEKNKTELLKRKLLHGQVCLWTRV